MYSRDRGLPNRPETLDGSDDARTLRDRSLNLRPTWGGFAPIQVQLNGMRVIGHCRKRSFFFLSTELELEAASELANLQKLSDELLEELRSSRASGSKIE